MKTIMILMALTISLASLASETSTCKEEAHAAAIEAYSEKHGNAMVFSQTKFKVAFEGNAIVYKVKILDANLELNEILSVTLDKLNCRVITID